MTGWSDFFSQKQIYGFIWICIDKLDGRMSLLAWREFNFLFVYKSANMPPYSDHSLFKWPLHSFQHLNREFGVNTLKYIHPSDIQC